MGKGVRERRNIIGGGDPGARSARAARPTPVLVPAAAARASSSSNAPPPSASTSCSPSLATSPASCGS
eukprot:scaffold114433_cov24-Tisochrysis_lutea.AAC.3